MGRKLFFLALLISVAIHFAAFSPTWAQGSCTNTLTQPAGQAFHVGSTTASNQGGPVVVFVHGYTSDHATWTGSNYAVRDACNNGFRVAAVDLGGTSSIWANGQDLAGKLQSIAAYFNVSKVNIMAHSKGGLDSQTAIVHYGAHQYVQRYIAFGTPFGGTDLADHACSWYGSWLWQCNDATRDMRRGNMTYVRSITDPRPENGYVMAFAARGSKCDWYNPACALISGADDGVVPTWSVWASGVDSHIADRSDLRHGEIHQTQRHNTGWLFGYLGRESLLDGSEIPAIASGVPPRVTSNSILRAGESTGNSIERIPVEGGLRALNLTVIATNDVTVTAISPGGKNYALSVAPLAQESLLRGSAYSVNIPQPEAGEWTIAIVNRARDARVGYYLNVEAVGGLSVRIAGDMARLFQPGQALPLELEVAGRVRDVNARVNLRDSGQEVVARGEGIRATLPLPSTNGIYNVDITVTGTAADGSRFERTVVTSVAVVDSAALADPASVR